MFSLRIPTDIHDLDSARTRSLIDAAHANQLKNAAGAVLMYPVMVLVSFVATDLDENHPEMAYAVLGITLAMVFLRGAIPFRFRHMDADSRRSAIRLFNLGGLFSAALFTSLSVFSWHVNGLNETTFILLLLSGGMGAGTVTGVCMNLRLAYGFLAVTLVPLVVYGVVYGVVDGTPAATAIGVMYVAYSLLVLRFGKTGCRAYWEASIATMLLDEKAAFLEIDVATALKSAQAITRGRSRLEVVEGIVTCALEHVGFARGVLVLREDDGLCLAAQASSPVDIVFHSRPLPLAQAEDLVPVEVVQQVMDSGQPLSVGDMSRRPDLGRIPYVAERDIRCMIALPILTHGNTVGVLYLEDRKASRGLSSQRLEVLGMLAAQAAISLENVNFFDRVTKQEHWLASTLSCIRDAVITTNTEGKVTFCNPVAAHLTGWAESSALGRPLDEVMVLGPEPSETGSSTDSRLRCRDGNTLLIAHQQSAIVSSDGDEMGSVIVFRDVTHERAFQQRMGRSQRLESIDRLAGGVAHDFNNLLTVILTYTTMLSRERVPRHILDDIKEIHEAARSAETLTHQLLAFSRQQVLVPVPTDLNQVVVDMSKMVRRLLEDDIRLQIDLEPQLGCALLDKGKFEQVILNLVVNARDAMAGGGLITIETRSTVVSEDDAAGYPPGSYVRVQVSDTGHGMDADTRSRIFEPFFTTKQDGKGTGLGLAMVHGIVRQSEGFIVVESAPGEGTSISISLPKTEVQRARQVPEPKPAYGTGKTILLLEDTASVRRLAARVLEEQGYKVIQARSDELVRMERDLADVDLLLTDVIMPNVSGPDIARLLSKERPELRVLYMSGYAPDTVLERGVAADNFLQKPFTPHELKSKVHLALH